MECYIAYEQNKISYFRTHDLSQFKGRDYFLGHFGFLIDYKFIKNYVSFYCELCVYLVQK